MTICVGFNKFQSKKGDLFAHLYLISDIPDADGSKTVGRCAEDVFVVNPGIAMSLNADMVNKPVLLNWGRNYRGQAELVSVCIDEDNLAKVTGKGKNE